VHSFFNLSFVDAAYLYFPQPLDKCMFPSVQALVFLCWCQDLNCATELIFFSQVQSWHICPSQNSTWVTPLKALTVRICFRSSSSVLPITINCPCKVWNFVFVVCSSYPVFNCSVRGIKLMKNNSGNNESPWNNPHCISVSCFY